MRHLREDKLQLPDNCEPQLAQSNQYEVAERDPFWLRNTSEFIISITPQLAIHLSVLSHLGQAARLRGMNGISRIEAYLTLSYIVR